MCALRALFIDLFCAPKACYFCNTGDYIVIPLLLVSINLLLYILTIFKHVLFYLGTDVVYVIWRFSSLRQKWRLYVA